MALRTGQFKKGVASRFLKNTARQVKQSGVPQKKNIFKSLAKNTPTRTIPTPIVGPTIPVTTDKSKTVKAPSMRTILGRGYW